MLKTQNDAEYSAVSNTSQSQDGLVWLRGYLPPPSKDFKAAAAQAHWAWALEDRMQTMTRFPLRLNTIK